MKCSKALRCLFPECRIPDWTYKGEYAIISWNESAAGFGTAGVGRAAGREDRMQDYILIVEDDNDINHMLKELLTLEGYRVRQAFSGTEGLLYMKDKPTAVILDLMLPGMAGAEVLQQIKKESPRTAVIVASAKGDMGSRVSLLRAGADDYLTKPFDTEELLARLEAVLRRRSMQPLPAGQERVEGRPALVFRDITMYPEDFAVSVGGEELSLTKREYLILKLLMENPSKVFTKNNIYESVWNEEFLGEDNAVNVHISNIRSKLSKVRPGVNYIQTVWGIGFKMQQ